MVGFLLDVAYLLQHWGVELLVHRARRVGYTVQDGNVSVHLVLGFVDRRTLGLPDRADAAGGDREGDVESGSADSEDAPDSAALCSLRDQSNPAVDQLNDYITDRLDDLHYHLNDLLHYPFEHLHDFLDGALNGAKEELSTVLIRLAVIQ